MTVFYLVSLFCCETALGGVLLRPEVSGAAEPALKLRKGGNLPGHLAPQGIPLGEQSTETKLIHLMITTIVPKVAGTKEMESLKRPFVK